MNSEAFINYVATKFPTAQLETHRINFGEVHLRFELGGDNPNGTDERIAQAATRATTLFEQCNSAGDDVVMIIKDWDHSGREFIPATPPDYLYSLIRGYDSSNAWVRMVDDGQAAPYRQLIFPVDLGNVEYGKILEGIAHREQGRTPRISQLLYFVNMTNNAVFYMYDDRGCLIYSSARETLQELYIQRNDWLVDTYRPHFESLFGES